jgi:hypothetical protein
MYSPPIPKAFVVGRFGAPYPLVPSSACSQNAYAVQPAPSRTPPFASTSQPGARTLLAGDEHALSPVNSPNGDIDPTPSSRVRAAARSRRAGRVKKFRARAVTTRCGGNCVRGRYDSNNSYQWLGRS